MKKTILSAIALASIAGAANAATFDINLAGYQSFAGFSSPLNTRNTFVIGSGGAVTIDAVEFIDLDFTAEGASWQSELTISLNQTGEAAFWDFTPGVGIDEPGNFVGSGSFPNPGLFGSGPFPLLGDNTLLLYVYEQFNDAGNGRDAIINSGTLRITYTEVPAPAAAGVFGLAGLAGLRRRRA